MAIVDKAWTVIQSEENMKVTAVCEIIFREPSEDRPKIVGQGCLVRREQPNECCIVTTDKIIKSEIDKFDAFEVHFTKKYSKQKTFRLEDIKEKVRYVSGLVFIVINMKSSKLKRWNKICSIFTKSPIAINALDKSKQQFCYIGGDCHKGLLQVSSKTTIEFPGATSAIPEGLVILQSTSNPTDNSVDVVGIQSQLHDKKMTTIWITEVLAGHGYSQGNQDSAVAPITVPVLPSMSEPNPESFGGTASNQTDQTSVNAGQQSLACAGVVAPPSNELQNSVTNSETGSGYNTVVKHSLSHSNGDVDVLPGCGSVGYSSGGASFPYDPSGGFPEHAQDPIADLPANDHHGNSLTDPPVQGEQKHIGKVDCHSTNLATGQRMKTATENCEAHLAVNMQKSSVITRELPVGPSAVIHPPLEQGAKGEVVMDTQAKTTPDKTGQLTETAVAPVEAAVAQCNNTELNETAPGYGMFVVGGDEDEVLRDEDNGSTDFSLEANGGRSPTENSYQSLQRPASTKVGGKEETILTKMLQDNLASQPTVTDGEVVGGTLKNNVPPEKQRVEFRDGYDSERRRHSLPIDPRKKEHTKIKLCSSESLPILWGGKRKINLGDPLAKTILDCLDLLEGLGRLLDKEYKYGTCKCWKHIAECFGIEEDEYQNFRGSEIHSPTEVMFEYLQSSNPEITIGMVKDRLRSIERQDVIEVLVNYEQTYGSINDDTLVCSLFDSDPDVIGSMARLLDRQKKGLLYWTHLAGKLGIERSTFKSFETCNNCNPTEKLFEYLTVHFPRKTVEELISHLEAMGRRDVVIAIKKSTKVTRCSLIKDLMEDLPVMDNVCELLNRKPQTNKVLGWKRLGNGFGIDKDTLDVFSSPQEELDCPTEALIRHLGGRRAHLTMENFIWALHSIDRPDALELLNDYLPDGCITNLLRSSNCQMNGQSNSQGR